MRHRSRFSIAPTSIQPWHERAAQILGVCRPPLKIEAGKTYGWVTLVEMTTSLLIDGCLCRNPAQAVEYVLRGPGARIPKNIAYEETLARGLTVKTYAISAEDAGRGPSGEVMVLIQVHGFHSELE